MWGPLWTGISAPTNTVLSVLNRNGCWHLLESVYLPLNYTTVQLRRKSIRYQGGKQDKKRVVCGSREDSYMLLVSQTNGSCGSVR